MDMDDHQEQFSLELLGAKAFDSLHLRDVLMMSLWPNPDGILAWVLYSLGSAFLAAEDPDAVLEILAILKPIDDNLAGLLSFRLDHLG
jgi:hypothetical protein